MVKNVDAATTAAGTIGSANFPSDFGTLLLIEADEVDITIKSPVEFNQLKNNLNAEVTPSVNSQVALQIGQTQISLLPATVTGTYHLTYLIGFTDVTQNGATDIPLGDSFNDSILSFALEEYFINKYEVELATYYHAQAYKASPFPIVDEQRTS